ncbi:hypothetical protein F5148DRAFT_1211616 [Russula earlei]|uniref:Uncharacterized protein n=1 Tax=Russula earlei TaxID=71964 RepID=A0ACC0U4U2_9AGAM|nr:hypothetical protein F5148DRAFT_1211616 [Russula earlei]
MPSFSPPRNQSGRSTRSTESNSAEDHSSVAGSSTSNGPRDLRKPKSFMNPLNVIRRARSKVRLDAEDKDAQVAANRTQPLLPIFVSSGSGDSSFLQMDPSSGKNALRAVRGREKKKSKGSTAPPSQSTLQPEFNIDLNLERMEGIIDPSLLPQSTHNTPISSAGFAEPGTSGLRTDGRALTPSSSSSSPLHFAGPVFSDPFMSRPPSVRSREGAVDPRRMSPHTIVPVVLPQQIVSPPSGSQDGMAAWKAPPSWVTGDQPEPDVSSSEDEKVSVSKRKTRRRTTVRALQNYGMETRNFKIRVYRANTEFHILTCTLSTTVAQLTSVLNATLLAPGEREDHRLYLKERGRERMLAQTERPADIVRRRLEQAGYDVADGLDTLGEGDLSFLMKFVYKSTVLGPAEEDMIFTDYRNVDLTNKSLRTVPVALYGHAEDIKSLTLSRNPMLDIPGDFVQLCTSLQELRLSNMSIKKVPQSVQNFTTLMGLDLSSNRIGDINDIALYRLPDLQELRVQNNRMEKLPWYFPRLHMLRLLNISNNKFQDVPVEVCKMSGLEELDISFNMISQLPEDLQSLQRLKVLIVVGNRVARIPDSFRRLSSLAIFDCRRNNITELGAVSLLPNLEEVLVGHNDVQTLDLSSGPLLKRMNISHNDITQISLALGPVGRIPVALTYLNVSSAKLSSLDDLALGQLTSLEELILDRNKFRAIPDSLGELSLLQSFSCSDNLIGALPSSIGRLQRLERLDVHNNNLTEFPAVLWNCGSLERINMTSNVIAHIRLPSLPPSSPAPLPPVVGTHESAFSSTLTLVPCPPDRKASTTAMSSTMTLVSGLPDRKASTAGSIAPSSRLLPPLVKSLQRLYLGENRLTDDALPVFMVLRELRVLNLSFNDFQELPRQFFKEVVQLEELYLSGNKLAGLPTEDLPRLSKLEVLYLNGNRLLTLPQELGKVTNLAVLDVGSNGLRYNISNWEFDWNWNFNKNLKYLNLSGNKHLRIQTWQRRGDREGPSNELLERLAGFEELNQLRVLGLMDVTTTLAVNIPDDTEDRRVRTSVTLVNQLQYGIADNLGNREYLTMFDLVQPTFRENRDEAIFAMFGRSHASPHNTHISKFLHDNFVSTLAEQLKDLDLSKGESHPDALRRTFLKLNRLTHDHLFAAYSTNASGRKMSQASHRSAGAFLGINAADVAGSTGGTSSIGASGIVAYFRGHHLHVANVGNALAVMSRRGLAHVVSVKHEPFDRNEITRVRAAEGWVSPKGLVNDEADVSRSFGYYHLLPIINARPDVSSLKLSELDEFLIIANNGLWDYVSYQTAVDIARSERADPMIAAQKLRDFAISYGSEGTTMIMVISLVGMFSPRGQEKDHLLQDVELFPPPRRSRKDEVGDNETGRLDPEIQPPVGQVVLAFTDIVNSTRLWDVNATAMRTAVTMHHQLLRRHVRICGGYEVKTEGDAFMVAFTAVSAALLWCSSVQVLLLDEPWPKEILDLPEGREILDDNGTLIARGLSLRMGIHCGTPVCEMDLVSRRMDYYGPMVNRASRVANSAAGGQILLSADAVRELKAEEESLDPQLVTTIDALRSLDLQYVDIGEKKLKGLEIPEVMTAVYPQKLLGRRHVPIAVEQEPSALVTVPEDAVDEPSADELPSEFGGAALSGDECCWTPEQVRELSHLAVRLQTLAGGRVFRPLPVRKGSRAQVIAPADADFDRFLYSDLSALAPSVSDRLSEAELIGVLNYLLLQLELVTESLSSRLRLEEDRSSGGDGVAADVEAIKAALALRAQSGRPPLDPGTLRQVLELVGR